MSTLTKAISGILAVGALGLAINAQAVDERGPETAAPVAAPVPVAQPSAAAPQTQAPYYPAYGYQSHRHPSYYGYRGPWSNNRGWTPRRSNRNYNSNYRDNRNYWDNSNRWGNRNWSNYELGPLNSAVDTFGHMDIEMDFELEFDWDMDADIDSDVDGYGEGYGRNDNRFDNRFNNSYYNRYYNGYYGRYAPYNYYYNYQYGYNYPLAPQASTPPVPAPQPPVAAEPAEVDGKTAAPVKPISIDDDKDRVLNSSDFCPNSAEGVQVDAFGCAIDKVIVLRGVNFHTDSDKLTDESIVILDGVSATLNAYPDLKLEVSGHTDSDAEDDHNKHLSQRRAERVREYLISKGSSADNLTAKGYGEERPISSNETAEGKALNRRVELNRL